MRYFKNQIKNENNIVVLNQGDDLLKSIEKVIQKENINNGFIASGIGSLSKARYHIVEPGDDNPWKDRYIEKEGTIEIVSISGIIANKEPHLHIALSQEDKGFGGHLERGSIVLTLAEIVILELDENMKRIVGKEGFGCLNIEK